MQLDQVNIQGLTWSEVWQDACATSLAAHGWLLNGGEMLTSLPPCLTWGIYLTFLQDGVGEMLATRFTASPVISAGAASKLLSTEGRDYRSCTFATQSRSA